MRPRIGDPEAEGANTIAAPNDPIVRRTVVQSHDARAVVGAGAESASERASASATAACRASSRCHHKEDDQRDEHAGDGEESHVRAEGSPAMATRSPVCRRSSGAEKLVQVEHWPRLLREPIYRQAK